MTEELLRCVDTNAAGDEVDAIMWGIRFELLYLASSGVAVSIVVVAALFWLGCMTVLAVPFAAFPGVATLAFAWFKQLHPPGYDSDMLDLWIHGPGFGPEVAHESIP